MPGVSPLLSQEKLDVVMCSAGVLLLSFRYCSSSAPASQLLCHQHPSHSIQLYVSLALMCKNHSFNTEIKKKKKVSVLWLTWDMLSILRKIFTDDQGPVWGPFKNKLCLNCSLLNLSQHLISLCRWPLGEQSKGVKEGFIEQGDCTRPRVTAVSEEAAAACSTLKRGRERNKLPLSCHFTYEYLGNSPASSPTKNQTSTSDLYC